MRMLDPLLCRICLRAATTIGDIREIRANLSTTLAVSVPNPCGNLAVKLEF
jgi:hypothetical protein